MSLLCFSAIANGLAMTEQRIRPEERDQGKQDNVRRNQEAEETKDDGSRAEQVLKHVSCLQREASEASATSTSTALLTFSALGVFTFHMGSSLTKPEQPE